MEKLEKSKERIMYNEKTTLFKSGELANVNYVVILLIIKFNGEYHNNKNLESNKMVNAIQSYRTF